MKNIKYIYSLILATALVFTSCKDFLDEQPRSNLTPDFFTTTQGIESGLTAAYSGLRYQYGTQSGLSISCVGTDESTKGGDGNEEQINNYGVDLLGAGHFQTPWNRSFPLINTCNGIVDYATGANLALVAEAKFLRAQYYYTLVTTFGGVPLDLGGGKLKFTTSPSTTSVRNTAIEVYEAMVQDLKDAIDGLPQISQIPGRVGKAAAIHYLAKTYLAMACYYDYDYTNEIQNDTLSTASYSNVNPTEAKKYYELALSTAKLLIDNRGSYGVGLLADFADVNETGNEHNIESLFTVEHTSDYTFDESGAGASGGAESGLKENRANFMFTAYYDGPDGDNGLLERTPNVYGRGWRRFVPTKYLLETVFADKVNDTRYYKTFQSLWVCNKSNHVDYEKPAIFMPGVESYGKAQLEVQKVIDLMKTKGSASAKKLIRYSPDYTRNMFPTNLKFMDTNGNGEKPGDSSHRPFIVSKFSETLLIAAEAAFKLGKKAESVEYINELRVRAAKGNVLNTHISGLVNETAAASYMKINEAQLTLDFILDERSRELCNEQLRWFDLVRTNTLIPRLQAGDNKFGTSDDSSYADKAAANVRRYHHLRPIPQGQMDAMTGDNKKTYQNPGY
ncbi:putative outer membrane protein [uncultured Paludibacter sp.]|uniref:Putative outer membrane protein n=1 Tax=uncultured Paludibacter sp. TaxID=497635 RepID=A0A653AL36_9BACT|nr:putative outer membrane protein [uncultured Paludibacter sp.]